MRGIASLTLAFILVSSGVIFILPTEVESDGSGDYPAPATGDWIISSPTYVGNETIVLNGNLTILPTGSLTFHNVTLKMNCSVNGSYHINVTTGGSLYVYDLDNDNTTTDDASVITSNNPDGQHRYLFWVRKDANFTIKNSELHECGYEVDALRENVGIKIQSDNAIIDHSLISNNFYGIYLRYGNISISNNTISNNDATSGFGIRTYISNPYIKNNRFFNNRVAISLLASNPIIENNSISAYGNGINGGAGSSPIITNNQIFNFGDDGISMISFSSATITGCSIEGGNYGIATSTGCNIEMINTTIENTALWDIRAGPNCQFKMLNCSFNKTKVQFSDILAELTLQHYLNTYVNDTNNLPTPIANINVKNITGTDVFTGQTGIDGWRNWTIVTEYVQKDLNGDSDGEDPGEKVFHTPHNITVTKAGYFDGYAEPHMNESQAVTITLTPLPTFNITLLEGWNLISLPLEQRDESINVVLENISDKWDRVLWYNASDPSNHWKSYNKAQIPVGITQDLLNIDHTIGFWINITEPNVTLTVSGLVPTSTSIPLYAGWNMVSYPSLTTETVANALWGTGADRVEAFNASQPYNVGEVGPNYIMKPGEGYWVHVPADTMWVVDW